ncbi:MAG: sulfur carrier protein ThiS [Luteolibacter sp.]|uniref:sulfur carrier protein ThiS n=1 Tax=Luteolibacter sp. TaxID=1962973 RepID=UPI003263B427
MNIQLNGTLHEIAAAMSVADLLASIGLGGKPVVVELDEQAVFPRDYPQLMVGEGARVEVVMLAAGG